MTRSRAGSGDGPTRLGGANAAGVRYDGGMTTPDHNEPYADIIGCARPESARAPMPLEDRAAQFSPFAALTGHEDAVAEAARYVEARPALGDVERDELDRTLATVRAQLREQPHVLVTWFKADPAKEGGACQMHEGRVRTVDELANALVFADGARISLDDVLTLRILPL